RHTRCLSDWSSDVCSSDLEILRVAEQRPLIAGALSQLNFRLGELFAGAAIAACRQFRVALSKIALVGSHGQTIFHQGCPMPYFEIGRASCRERVLMSRG